MSIAIFDSKRDATVIAGGGFFCRACVVGKPPEELSPDDRYCQGCADILAMDKAVPSAPDTWSQDDMVFTHYGRRYTLSPGLRTICLDDTPDIVTDGGQATQGKESARHKIENEDIHGSEVTQKAIKGRKPLDLPIERVLELSAAGRSIRDIADETFINRETVRRIVAGQRVMGGVI